MRTSERGKEFIRHREGVRTRAYDDGGGVLTIGIGHVIKPSDDFGLVIDMALVEDLFAKDLLAHERELEKSLAPEVALEQHEWDAMSDFTFNVGGPNLRKSRVLREINSGNKTEAGQYFKNWIYDGDRNGDGVVNYADHVKGLLKRRLMEQALFERGDYGLN